METRPSLAFYRGQMSKRKCSMPAKECPRGRVVRFQDMSPKKQLSPVKVWFIWKLRDLKGKDSTGVRDDFTPIRKVKACSGNEQHRPSCQL